MPSRSSADGVGDMRHVRRPVGHRLIGMRVRQPRARSSHSNHAQAELLGGATADQRKLAPAAGGAVEPQHRLPRRVAELGEAETTAGGQVEAALGAWLLDARNAEGVPHRVGHSHRHRG